MCDSDLSSNYGKFVQLNLVWKFQFLFVQFDFYLPYVSLYIFVLGCLGFKRFMPITQGQWSDTRDLTTTSEKVKFWLGNLQKIRPDRLPDFVSKYDNKIIFGNKPRVQIRSRNSPFISISFSLRRSMLKSPTTNASKLVLLSLSINVVSCINFSMFRLLLLSYGGLQW